jgi:hypothetical protein
MASGAGQSTWELRWQCRKIANRIWAVPPWNRPPGRSAVGGEPRSQLPRFLLEAVHNVAEENGTLAVFHRRFDRLDVQVGTE